jgi:thioesterase domain-containing protein
MTTLESGTPEFWEERLIRLWRGHIPLAAAMEVSIARIDAGGLELTAPLQPSANHMGTAFGGALQALATLAGWGVSMIAAGPAFDGHMVIAESRMRFLAPVPGPLHARCAFPPEFRQRAFRSRIAERGRARLDLEVIIGENGGASGTRDQARFEGRFVALAARHAAAE